MLGSEFGLNNMKSWFGQSGCIMLVFGVFSWHTLGPKVQTEHQLNGTAYASIVRAHVHPFMAKVYPSNDGCFWQVNIECQIISI